MKRDGREMTRIAPGVYADEDGGMHIDVHEMLRAHGFDDNAENRATLEQEIRTIAAAYGIPETEVD
jgi:hypothetical protein